MRRQQYISLIVGLLFMGAAVVLWAMPAEQSSVAVHHNNNLVLLDSVQTAHVQRSARFAGVTQAKNRAVLSFTVPARVVERQAASGAIVRQGDVLARLDDREFQNAVHLAQAAFAELETRLAQARRDRVRMASLAASDVIPVAELEKVTTRQAALQAALRASAARLKEAKRLLKETELTAPFSGTVTHLYIQPGEWAVPGQPAVELTGDGPVELLVQVPETMLDRIVPDQPVQVQLPFADNRLVPGRISTIARAALTAGRLFPLKVDVAPEPGVIAGMTAQLIIDLSTEGVLTVPLSAVANPSASRPYLFIYRNGRVAKRSISIGSIIGERIVVRGDLHPGDPVVVSGQSQLTDGEKVEVTS